MTIESFVADYGLLAVFAGAGLEGEAVLITAGILAHKGLLPIWGVAGAGAAGSCLIDQLWFWLGRSVRGSRWVQKVKARPAFARAVAALERRPTAFILGFRFVYGMRTVSPIAIGAAHVSARKFVLLNIIAAIVWAPLIAWLGYAFGKAVDPWLHDAKSAVLLCLAGLVALGLLIVLARVVHNAVTRSSSS